MAWALGHLYVFALQPAAKGFCFISAFKTHGIFFSHIPKSNAKRLVFLSREDVVQVTLWTDRRGEKSQQDVYLNPWWAAEE